MTADVQTSPDEYITNTNEADALALDVTAELAPSESLVSAACELRRSLTREDVSVAGFPQPATISGNVVTQPFDARALTADHYDWIWNVTLNTGAIRSYSTLLRVDNHA